VSGPGFRERLLSRAALECRDDLTPILAGDVLDQLEAYFRLLNHWNRTINLSALELDPPSDAAIDRLLLEPLTAARHVPDRPVRWFDLGSGSGSPAIPLKLARPLAGLTMVEARSRKAAFLRELVRELRLPDTGVIGERFEAVAQRADLGHSVDYITTRGVRIDASFLNAAHLFLQSDGRLLVFGDVSRGILQRRFAVIETLPLLRSDPQSRLIVLGRNHDG
jgi:16S rRNA (guanine(527)-N(7))-methyltransferase RsmG